MKSMKQSHSYTEKLIPKGFCLIEFCKTNQSGMEFKVMREPLSLKTIQHYVKTCKKCELCNTRNNAVPGIGNENADIVFIGEAPGKNEDLHGEPFIGTAGKILDDALENAGLRRSNGNCIQYCQVYPLIKSKKEFYNLPRNNWFTILETVTISTNCKLGGS